MEAPEKPGTAKAVAQWFAGPNAPQASAHFNVDDAEIWQSVKEHDVAWAAPGANKQGIHIEHAGYASQSAAQWADPYSEAMLVQSARLVADLCARHSVPIQFLPAVDLLTGTRGITTHLEVSRAWHLSDHTDPGPNFPMAHYLNLVREAAAPPPPPDPPDQEVEGMKITAGRISVASLDENGRGWIEVPSTMDRLMFVEAQGPAPATDGYWPPVTCNVNDRGPVTVVTLSGAPHQSTIVYWKALIDG